MIKYSSKSQTDWGYIYEKYAITEAYKTGNDQIFEDFYKKMFRKIKGMKNPATFNNNYKKSDELIADNIKLYSTLQTSMDPIDNSIQNYLKYCDNRSLYLKSLYRTPSEGRVPASFEDIPEYIQKTPLTAPTTTYGVIIYKMIKALELTKITTEPGKFLSRTGLQSEDFISHYDFFTNAMNAARLLMVLFNILEAFKDSTITSNESTKAIMLSDLHIIVEDLLLFFVNDKERFQKIGKYAQLALVMCKNDAKQEEIIKKMLKKEEFEYMKSTCEEDWGNSPKPFIFLYANMYPMDKLPIVKNMDYKNNPAGLYKSTINMLVSIAESVQESYGGLDPVLLRHIKGKTLYNTLKDNEII